ncbi:MAG: tyrosine-type recombinase/integrase, partial [Roseibium sp.]
LAAKLWTVPAGRMKASEQHEVPLSDAALSVLQAVHEDGLEADHVVFLAPRGGLLSDMSLSAVLKRMGRQVTVHGMRSAFRDWAGDTTSFPRDVVEMALAHAIGSATERAYRRGRALEKRRELMEAWASYCLP